MKGLTGCRPSWFLNHTVSGGGGRAVRPGRQRPLTDVKARPESPRTAASSRRPRGAAAPGPFSYLVVRGAGRPRVKPGATRRCGESNTLRRPGGTRPLPHADPRKPLPQCSAPGAGPGGRGQKGGSRAGPRWMRTAGGSWPASFMRSGKERKSGSYKS